MRERASQCVIWGTGALVGSNLAKLAVYRSVVTAGGCIAGATSWVAGHFEQIHNAGRQCAVWGLTSIIYAVGVQENWQRILAGAASCAAGAHSAAR